jgi:hypothetical protein
MSMIGTIVCLFVFLVASSASADDFALDLPLDCVIGVDCWVQQYVDHDASASVKDYACGAETYDGHDGTDFRIQNTSAHVGVLAAAAGTVKAMRDSVEDHLVKTENDRARVKNIECGNGVVIDHMEGWQTQYCHMRKGTLRVKPGDAVNAGDVLGEVGYSGGAAFPHVHITVRKNGAMIDPFGGATCNAESISVWRKQPKYNLGDIIAAGFHDGPVEIAQLETGSLRSETPSGNWRAMVAYFWAINLKAGDKITVILRGPMGAIAENSELLDHNKAQYMLFAGKKQPAGGWSAGVYSGGAIVMRDGVERMKRQWQIEVK